MSHRILGGGASVVTSPVPSSKPAPQQALTDYKELLGVACARRWPAVRHAAAVLVPNPRLPELALRVACACADLALMLLSTCDDSRELVRALDALRDVKDMGCTGVLGVHTQLDEWAHRAEEESDG